MKIKAQDNKSSPKEGEEDELLYPHTELDLSMAKRGTWHRPQHSWGPPQNEDKILCEVLQLSNFGIIISQYFKTSYGSNLFVCSREGGSPQARDPSHNKVARGLPLPKFSLVGYTYTGIWLYIL